MKAMILAAGRGMRMRPLTLNSPKPLLKAAGKPLIYYHLERLSAAGITDVVINHSWLGEQLEDALGDGSDWGLNIKFSGEEELLETGGGIKKALPLLGDEPFLVINGDVYSDFSLRGLTEKKMAATSLAHLIMVSNPEHNSEGDFFLDMDGRVHSGPGASSPKLTFGGISIISPLLVKLEKEMVFPLGRVLRKMAAEGKVSGQHYAGYWMDVGTPERLALLNSKLLAGTVSS